MSRTATQYKTLTQGDYVKLMQLLPRLRLEVERNGDTAQASIVLATTKIVGTRAKEFIDEQASASDDGAASWAREIVNGGKEEKISCENHSHYSDICGECKKAN